MKKEICQNCEREIGKLEQAYIFKGQVVCNQCNALLGGNGTKPPVQTIEQTGKFYKGMMLTGLLLAAIAIPVACRGYIIGGIGLGIAGMVIFIVGNLFAWWYHG